MAKTAAEGTGQDNTDTGAKGTTPKTPSSLATDAEGTPKAKGEGEGTTDTTDDGKDQGTDDGKGKGKDDTSGDGNKGKEPGSKDGEKDTPKAPEKYELTLPEEGRLGDEDIKLVTEYARANGLTNDEAQAVLDQHADALQAQAERFLAETTADPDYGGDALEENQRHVRKLLDRVRPEGTERGKAFRQVLARSGYGNNRHVFAFLTDVAKMMAEDDPTGGDGGKAPTPPTTKEDEQAGKLYGSKS